MKLYRFMKAAADGLPEVGTKFGMLGVRPRDPAKPKKRFDVPAADPADPVRPGDGGLSVYADPAGLRPPDDEFLLWEMDADSLGPGLVLREDRPPHYVIEPAGDTTLAGYQLLLAGTRAHWRRVE